jgi:hypothetical protein
MRVVALYHPKSDHEGIVLDYIHDYQMHSSGKTIEPISLETSDGSRIAELYDVTRYPAILALSDDGQLQHFWQGLPLPMMNEIDVYSQDYDYDMAFAKAALLSI